MNVDKRDRMDWLKALLLAGLVVLFLLFGSVAFHDSADRHSIGMAVVNFLGKPGAYLTTAIVDVLRLDWMNAFSAIPIYLFVFVAFLHIMYSGCNFGAPPLELMMRRKKFDATKQQIHLSVKITNIPRCCR